MLNLDPRFRGDDNNNIIFSICSGGVLKLVWGRIIIRIFQPQTSLGLPPIAAYCIQLYMYEKLSQDNPEQFSLKSEIDKYEVRCGELEIVCSTALNINDYIARRPANLTVVKGSVFFNIICIIILQLRRIIGKDKHRSLGPIKEDFFIYDSHSPSVLIRSLLESYLHFFYLCVENVSDQVRDLRFSHWDWQDYNDRIRGLGPDFGDKGTLDGLIQARDKIETAIRSSTMYGELRAKWKKKLFQDGHPVIKPKAEIAASAGIHRKYYRQIYLFLSVYAHCGPMAVSHHHDMAEFKAIQTRMLSDCAEYAQFIGCYAIRDMVRLFPDARLRVHKKVYELLDLWTFMMQNWDDASKSL